MKSKKRAKARKRVKIIKALKMLCDETDDRVIVENNEEKIPPIKLKIFENRMYCKSHELYMQNTMHLHILKNNSETLKYV